jgi:hypothetical protein
LAALKKFSLIFDIPIHDEPPRKFEWIPACFEVLKLETYLFGVGEKLTKNFV